MRVCLVTAFPPDTARPKGGVEAVSVTLVRALAAIPGLEIHVVTADKRAESPTTEPWDGVTVHRLPWRGRWTLTSALGVARRDVSAAVARVAPDVVHAHDTFGLMVRAIPYPRVLTIHGFIHSDTKVAARRFAGPRAALWRVAEERTWADFPHIISISPYVRERLARVALGVIHDIDNPIAPDFFEIEPRDETPIVFSAAVISRRKNTLALIEAVARLKAAGVPVHLRLAGPVVEESYGRRVTARVAELRLESDVTHLGAISTGAVRAELARARVFALVSREENSPLGIEEAMAAGVPVVASNRCGMPYMVRDGVTGFLVDPERPAEIADCLRAILADAPRRLAMSRRSREIARDRFHPEIVAARTIEVYLRALRSERAVATV